MSNWEKQNEYRTLVGRPWRRKRSLILLRDLYLCQACRRKGILTEATEVDHIVPLSKGGTDDDTNLESICSDCHGVKTQVESGHAPQPKQSIGNDGWPK